jgi:hypothetical protein
MQRTTAQRPMVLKSDHTAGITVLLPVLDRLRERFDICEVCVVADKAPGPFTSLGARLRSGKEIRDTMLSRGGRYREVLGPR